MKLILTVVIIMATFLIAVETKQQEFNDICRISYQDELLAE